jgi:hypothetical protein
MQLHPELTTALVDDHRRELHMRAEQRRMLSTRDLPAPTGTRARLRSARRALSGLVPRAASGSGGAST